MIIDGQSIQGNDQQRQSWRDQRLEYYLRDPLADGHSVGVGGVM